MCNKVLSFWMISFLMLTSRLWAQTAIQPGFPELRLKVLSERIWKTRDDAGKLQANAVFLDSLSNVLKTAGAFSYPFDSLTGISKLEPEDHRFRIFTWNVPLADGTFKYFGLILLQDSRIFPLSSDKKPVDWENRILDYSSWYGALYYEVITQRIKGRNLYTLLGWDGNNGLTDRKIIDILSFTPDSVPTFGEGRFKTSDGIKNRYIFEYAEKSNALVRYDEQTLLLQKGKRIREKKSWMIIMDHLAPINPSFEGIKKYYVPSGDWYDAFVFIDGNWVFAEDVKVANPVKSNKSAH